MLPTANDWFLPAIFTDGSVGDCLGAVISELEQRRDFVVAVKSRLEPGNTTNGGNAARIDAVTDLGNRIKPLENTLRTRLPMLLPDRPGAWFRVSAARTSGPFATAVLHEPVFAPYGSAPPALVREGLVNAWKGGATSVGVFRVGIRCLWLTLLELNARYRAINELDGDHAGLALDRLPDGLPGHLDCKSLRAFLANVRNELQGCRERLDACYRDLLASSDLYFDHQARNAPGTGTGAGAWRDRAEDFRDEQSRRRNAFSPGSGSPGRSGATIKTAKDIEALRYFGFSDFPAVEELRRKYLELAKKYHPDSGTGHEEKFKTLSRVYDHLLQRCGA
jgi:hypothetical protein